MTKGLKKNEPVKMEEPFLPLDFFGDEEKKVGKKKKHGKNDTLPDLFSAPELWENRKAPETPQKLTEATEDIEKSVVFKEEKLVEKIPESDIITGSPEETEEETDGGTVQDFEPGEKGGNDEVFPGDDIKFEISYSETETENTNYQNTEEIMAENEIKSNGEDIPGLENTDNVKEQAPAPEASGPAKAPSILSVAREKNPAQKPIQKPVIKTPFAIKNKNASPGQILQEARTNSGLSMEQVEHITKIRLSYLEALERDDLPKLPPSVYITAYIKNLSSLYGISPEDTAVILSNLKKSGEKPVTEDILKHLESEKHVNIQEEAKGKRLILKSAVIIVLVVVWIGILGIIIHKSGLLRKFRSSEKAIAGKVEKAKESKPSISIKAVKEAEEKAREAAASKGPGKETAATTKTAATPKEGTKAPPAAKETPAPVRFSGAELEKFVPPQKITLSELSLEREKPKK